MSLNTLSHKTLIRISGTVWLLIGSFLLNLGINLLMRGVEKSEMTQAIFLLTVALIVGHYKGRYVLAKVAERSFHRICALPNPTSLKNLYTRGNYVLIALMMALGMCMRAFDVPPIIRGCIDCAVGAALIQGSIRYYRLSSLSKESSKE